MPNRLADRSSPYLRQHAGNPVAWWPWCPEAFAEARRREVPVLVSIGYSTCHWCHVMAHECFEDPDTAAVMDRELVCIKVDREEHPEVDAIYMDALQGLTGHGGWPLNAFADHQGRPFHACSYQPKEPWTRLVAHLGRLWREDRGRLDHAAGEITDWLRRQESATPADLPADLLDRLAAQLDQAFDPRDPGLAWSERRAPKFPPSPLLAWLVDGPAEQLARAGLVLEAMQDGGIHDRVGGGFHRYSVDAGWRLPHFEKMLYDNAQLMGCYARAGARLGRADFLTTAINAADYVLRDLRLEGDGRFLGYAVAEDADDPGGEGAFYAWSPADLAAVLGERAGADLAAAWDLAPGVPEPGPHGHLDPVVSHIPHPRGAGVPAGPAGQAVRAAWEPLLPTLRAVRDRRPRPGLDDQPLTDQQGLLLEGLAWVARLGGQERHQAAVAELAALVCARRTPAGLVRLPGLPALVTDYGAAAMGLLAAYDLLGDPALVDTAAALVDEAVERLAAAQGGFHLAPAGRSDLVRRGWEPLDNAWPAGQSQLAWAAARLAAITGDAARADLARRVLRSAGDAAGRAPIQVPTLLRAWRLLQTGGTAVTGEPALLAAVRAHPGESVAVVDAAQAQGRSWPCLAAAAGEAAHALHVCRAGSCRIPIADPGQAAAALDS